MLPTSSALPRPVPAGRALTINAVFIYLTAYLVTIILHETGHALMSLALGGRPVLYSTWVENRNQHLPGTSLGLIAGAGPVLSLVQGLSLLAGLRRRPPGGAWGLFWLYMALFGIINFMGYVLIAPLAKTADTGQIMALLHVPAAVQWALAGLSLYGLIKIIGRTAPLFLRLLPAAVQADAGARPTALRGLIGWPWLVGSVVLVLLALPAPHPAVVANMFMSPMVLRRAYANGLGLAPVPAAPGGLLRGQWLPVVAGLVVALVFRLLARGLAW